MVSVGVRIGGGVALVGVACGLGLWREGGTGWLCVEGGGRVFVGGGSVYVRGRWVCVGEEKCMCVSGCACMSNYCKSVCVTVYVRVSPLSL